VISAEQEAKILRLFHAEQWRPNTIARQLGVHHSTVRRVLAQAGQESLIISRPSILDPYMGFLSKTLEIYPQLTAARLCGMIRARGYQGSEAHLRAIVARIRPRPKHEAYLRLRTLPGEQAQVDWAHFGKIRVGRAERRLYGFVMVLSYSRAIFLRFYLGHDHTAFFLRGHQEAFEFFGGVPRALLYDNLKSAVLEREGSAIRFNPRLLEFAGHYHFEPRPVAVARGNEKGRVERAIRYVRDNFYAARRYRDLDDLNAQARGWCLTVAQDRPCPEDRSRRVREVLADDQARLLPIPQPALATDEQRAIRIGKTPYLRFDLNDYSVPHTLVGKSVTLLASPETIRVLDGTREIACHPRTYDRDQQVENPEHVRDLVAQKRAAREGRGMNRLVAAVPRVREVFELLATEGMNLGSATSTLLRCLDHYGQRELVAAVDEVLAAGRPRPAAIRQVLERRRHARKVPPPLEAALTELARHPMQPVRAHSLDQYDRLTAKEGCHE
jgi:transposase